MRKIALFLLMPFFLILSNAVSAQTTTYKAPVDSAAMLRQARKRVDSLTLAISKNPDKKALLRLYVKRGLGEGMLGHPDSAIYDYCAAIALNPNLPEIYVYRSAQLQRTNKYAYAIGDLKMAISLLPNNPARASTLYAYISYICRALRNYDQALKADSAAIALDPNNGLAYVSSGWTYFGSKQYQKAIEAFDAGIPLTQNASPKAMSENLVARADAKKALKKYKGAINDYSLALNINPDNKYIHWSRAACYNNNGDYELADAEYTKTMTYYSGDKTSLAKLYYDRARMEMGEQKYKGALRDDSLATTYDNNNALAYWGMADAYSLMGDFQQSIRLYKQTMQYYDNNDNNKAALSLLNNNIADGAYFMAKYDQVVHYTTKAIELDAKAWIPYLNRGRAYLRLRKNDNAMKDFNKVLALDTTKAFAYAFALFYTGNADKAIKVMQDKAISTNDPAILISHYYNLACLYSLMNKPDEANTYLKKCIDGGYSKKYAQTDPDLENIRGTQDFMAMINAN